MSEPTFRLQFYDGISCGAGTKLFAFGREVQNIEKIEFDTSVEVNDLNRFNLNLVLLEPVAIGAVGDERDPMKAMG